MYLNAPEYASKNNFDNTIRTITIQGSLPEPNNLFHKFNSPRRSIYRKIVLFWFLNHLTNPNTDDKITMI